MEGEGVRDAAELVEIIDLPPHIVVGDIGAAGVGAQAHGNAPGQAGLGAVDDAVHDELSVILLRFRRAGDAAVKQRIGQGRRDGGDMAGLALFKQAKNLLVGPGTVLNGVYPALQGHPDPLGALHMGGHGQAQGVGLVTGGLHQGRGHFQLPGLPLALGVQNAAGDHQLNKIGLVLSNFPDQGRRLLRGGGLVGQGPGHVAPGHGHSHVPRQNPGAHGPAGENLIPEPGVYRLDAAHGAEGGDAGEQLRFGVACADPERNRAKEGVAGHEADGLFGVLLLDGGLARGRQVDMEVNKAGHYIAAGEVDFLVVRGLRPGGDDGLDTVAL